MTHTVGIDPGMNGAIAVLDDAAAIVELYDMPVAGGSVSVQLLATLAAWGHDCYGTVVIEDVHAMPRQGVTSSFGFGRSKGVVEGVFAGAGRPLTYIAPGKWKRDLRLTKDKGACRQRAVELWPSWVDSFKRAKDDGRAEAALIAYWYLQHGARR